MKKENNLVVKVISNWKNIAILVLLVGCLIFGWFTFFGSDSAYKERIKQLEKENRESAEARAKLSAEIESRKAEYDKLKAIESQLITELSLLEGETARLRDDAQRSRDDFDAIQTRLVETREKIKKLKETPANRKDEDLINSLKIKFK